MRQQNSPKLKTLKNHRFSLSVGALAALGSVFEASWRCLGGVLERLGGVLKLLGASRIPLESDLARLKTSKNHLMSLLFGALAALGTVLERLGGVLKTSWRRFGAADAVAAATAASDAASKLLRSALESIFSCFEALLERLEQFMFS